MAVSTSGAPRWRHLADLLTGEIRSGVRAPGSRLPSIAEQETLGNSQTTTLRAYRELMNRGLAVSVQGSGTYVADPVPEPEHTVTLEELDARVRALEAWQRECRCGAAEQ